MVFLSLSLPDTQPKSEEDDGVLRNYLHRGRRGSWSWDPAESSLALYLYDKLGKEGVDAAVAVGKNKEAGPKDVLNHLPTEIVEEVASSLAVVMPTKSDVLSQIASVIG